AHTLGTLRLFYPAAALRHLRSFPTRRSSDLDLEIARAEMTAMGGAGEDGDFRMRVRAPFSGVISERGFVPGGRVEAGAPLFTVRSEEHTSELQSRENLVCRLLLEKKKNNIRR